MSRDDAALRDALIHNLHAHGPRALLDLADDDPQTRIDADEALLEAMLAGDLPPMVQRIWTNRLCIVATRAQSRLPAFGAAAAASGIPVAVRPSAGSAVIHHEGTLQVSLVEALEVPALERGYHRLVGLLAAAFAPLGICITPAAIPGAYCDGRFNLCAAGRKIGGTAALIRTRKGRSAGLFHACVTLSGDVRNDVARVSVFERTLGIPSQYRHASHCAAVNARDAE